MLVAILLACTLLAGTIACRIFACINKMPVVICLLDIGLKANCLQQMLVTCQVYKLLAANACQVSGVQIAGGQLLAGYSI